MQSILDEEQRKKAVAEDKDENVLFQDVFKFRGIIGQGQFGVVLLVQNVECASPTKKENFELHNYEINHAVDEAKIKSYSALKVMHKNALHPDEVKVIRGEAKILEMLVDERNIVQIKDVSEELIPTVFQSCFFC